MDRQSLRFLVTVALVAVLIFILFIIIGIISILGASSSSNNNVSTKTIEQIIRDFGGEYIAEVAVEDDDQYPEQHLVKFNKPLIDVDGNTNREAYENLFKEVAIAVGYRNTELVDEDGGIKINIICSRGEITSVLINGIEDYFTVIEEQLKMKNYSEIKITDFEIQAVELLNLIRNNWSTDYGEEESEFQRFKEYSSRGFKVKYLNSDFYNIIFTTNYDDYVVNNIKPSDSIDRAKSILGTPTFKNENESMIGYKGKDFYIFFSEGEISVYRNYRTDDYTKFMKLVEDFNNGDFPINTVFSKITEIWPEYNEYIYTEDGFYISFPMRGVAIKWNYDKLKHFIIYNNSNLNNNQIAKLSEYQNVLMQRAIDAYELAETERVAEKDGLDKEFKSFIDTYGSEENYLINPFYDLYVKKDLNNYISALYAVSKDKSKPDRQLINGVRSFAWYNDTILLYGIPESGIYYYDLSRDVRGSLITGDVNAEYKIKNCINGILHYDNEEVEIIL